MSSEHPQFSASARMLSRARRNRSFLAFAIVALLGTGGLVGVLSTETRSGTVDSAVTFACGAHTFWFAPGNVMRNSDIGENVMNKVPTRPEFKDACQPGITDSRDLLSYMNTRQKNVENFWVKEKMLCSIFTNGVVNQAPMSATKVKFNECHDGGPLDYALVLKRD
jgi:hypothetical protein